MSKLRVGIVFGGQSAEHEVSIHSAQFVISHIDQERYEVIPIAIDRKGEWHLFDLCILKKFWEDHPRSTDLSRLIDRLSSLRSHHRMNAHSLFCLCHLRSTMDLLFPVLHGDLGEDGSIQGLCRLANLPFVGSGVLSSALCLDKGMSKRVLRDAGFLVGKFQICHQHEIVDVERIIEEIKFPLFVKPTNTGSSVGVSKVDEKKELLPAIQYAFSFHHTILVEECITGREIVCGIVGNHQPTPSTLGEVVTTREFFDYQEKHSHADHPPLKIPAPISSALSRKIQTLAVQSFLLMRCAGMARVDFFVRNQDGKLFINELNTIPGFTLSSLYPPLWKASGLCARELINRLIDLALDHWPYTHDYANRFDHVEKKDNPPREDRRQATTR